MILRQIKERITMMNEAVFSNKKRRSMDNYISIQNVNENESRKQEN